VWKSEPPAGETGTIVYTYWTFHRTIAVRHQVPTVPDDLLCTACWRVPPCDHFPDPTRSTDPERDQPHHLCELCARSWAPMRSRWSWLACGTCRNVNDAIRDAYGARLPLGRHSLMNGGAVDLSEPDPQIRARQQAHLDEVLVGMRGLYAWGLLQAREIHETLMPAVYLTAARIPTEVWQAHAKASWRASCTAWLGYSGLADFGELHDRMLRLYASGRLPAPLTVPPRDWQP
jgi:hypothetical protein